MHVPHHVSSKIPWYNLRKAHASLQKNWGDYMCEANFNMRMLRNIFTECHIYDKVCLWGGGDVGGNGEEPLIAALSASLIACPPNCAPRPLAPLIACPP